MQQTQKYKLNLIETSDTFSPAPLNENMEKVEAALEAKAGAADHAALEQRVISLEGHTVAVGTYTGNSVNALSTQFVDLGFTPRAVLIQQPNNHFHMAVAGMPYGTKAITIVEGGFKLAYAGGAANLEHNTSGAVYSFVAIL